MTGEWIWTIIFCVVIFVLLWMHWSTKKDFWYNCSTIWCSGGLTISGTVASDELVFWPLIIFGCVGFIRIIYSLRRR